jgi:hypothetical protein
MKRLGGFDDAMPRMFLSSKAFLLCALVLLGFTANAEPIQVPRYDDADDFLPAMEKKNANRIRLFLKQQPGEELFKVLTPRNVTVDVISQIPANAEFGVVFLLGGTSVLSIQNEKLDRSFSFQPRSRDYWWEHKVATFVVDAPSDKLDKQGITDARWRAGQDHRTDLKAVLDAISGRFKGPIVVHGHSNGALSVANAAMLNHDSVKAYVYSSGSHYKRPTTIIYDTVHTKPVIFVQHKADTCNVSTTAAFDEFVEKVKAPRKYPLLVDGGVEPMSGVCGAFAPHSFSGMEMIVINQQIPLIRKAFLE